MKIVKKLIFISLAFIIISGCQSSNDETSSVAEPAQEIANTSVPEPTEVPTNTPVPEPTPTSAPQPGDLLYETTFADFGDWEVGTLAELELYKNEPRSDGLYVKVPAENDFWVAYNDYVSGDVRMEVDVELIGGTDVSAISLYCRSSETGMYSFELGADGSWQIGKYDFDAENIYESLDSGTSNKINASKATNHITAICTGDEFALEINNHLLSSVKDSRFTDGSIGIGVDTFEEPLVEVVFHKIEVYIPEDNLDSESATVAKAQSGDLIYETTFADIEDWDIKARDDLAGYKSESRSDGLYLQVPDNDDFWIAYNNNLNADVRMEADVEKTNGTNFTYIDLYCRASEDGMYVFQLDTGGYWYIGKYDFNADQAFTQLASGGSNKIKVGNASNHMTAICDEDEFTFKINDELIASVQDSQFTGGGIGIGAETSEIPFAEFMFHNLEVYLP